MPPLDVQIREMKQQVFVGWLDEFRVALEPKPQGHAGARRGQAGQRHQCRNQSPSGHQPSDNRIELQPTGMRQRKLSGKEGWVIFGIGRTV